MEDIKTFDHGPAPSIYQNNIFTLIAYAKVHDLGERKQNSTHLSYLKILDFLKR